MLPGAGAAPETVPISRPLHGMRSMPPSRSPQSAVRSPRSAATRSAFLWTMDYGLSAVLSLALTGCAGLSSPRLPILARGDTTLLVEDRYEDFPGVIHIHTTYSHDADGRVEDVIRVANNQRLAFAILTEHNTLQPLRDGWQGWHGATLLLVGTELSTSAGHYLALNVTEEIDRSRLTVQQIVDEVNRQGGLGFIAHPYFKKAPWRDWSVTGMAGVEMYNALHDVIDEHRWQLAMWTLGASVDAFYRSLLIRPDAPITMWDQLIVRHGPLTGLAATDAHEVHVLGVNFAPYDMLFRLARTHLLIPSATLTAEGIYDALRRGHAYAAIELDVDAMGFVFAAQVDSEVVGIMGDTIPLRPHLALHVAAPAPGLMTLWRDGHPVAETGGNPWPVYLSA